MKHSLNYFIIGSSGVLNISEFAGVLMVDGVQMGYCDVSKKILEPRQEWAKNILKKHPEQLDWYKHKCFEDQPNFFRELISSLKQQFNQSEVFLLYLTLNDNETLHIQKLLTLTS